ncbi:MAG TPA: hypothetical protein VNN79_25425 [Actinomycetota bacterium]|nr:hypothetical protein [Actinomycetota bacterium]
MKARPANADRSIEFPTTSRTVWPPVPDASTPADKPQPQEATSQIAFPSMTPSSVPSPLFAISNPPPAREAPWSVTRFPTARSSTSDPPNAVVSNCTAPCCFALP